MANFPRTAKEIATIIDKDVDTVTLRFKKKRFVFFGVRLKVIQEKPHSPYRISEESFQKLAAKLSNM